MADAGGERPTGGRARICIDFGTALSKASACVDPDMPIDQGVRPLAIGTAAGAEHALLVPSIVYVDGGRIYFGPPAYEHAERGAETSRDPLLSFKTVLGARDVNEALATKIRPSIDPTGTLKQRDVLVLYLAYLDQLIREAVAMSPSIPPEVADARRRYTSPVWRPGSGNDRIFEQIFNEAAAVSAKLGRLFLSSDGISIAQAKDALDKALNHPGEGRLETGVFEPHAAAAASLAFSSQPARFVLVFDMGAGTTDIAAFDFDESHDPPALTEIKEARVCSGLAGDEIDRILVEMFVRKRGDSDRDGQLRMLRSTRLIARELKKELFTYGKCSLKGGFMGTTIKVNELMEDPQFREYLTKLRDVIGHSIAVVAARAEAAGAPLMDVVLAGGGSNLRFLPDLVKVAATDRHGPVSLRISALSPSSTLYDGIDPSLAAVFPQVSMSVGGALVEMLPAA